jgi:hypothetical protein
MSHASELLRHLILPSDIAADAFARRLTLALAPLVLFIVLIPLLATSIPPLHDYPFHLARMDAIAALTGEVAHPTHYQLGSFLLPNVAMDLAALGLTAFLPPLLAGRVFLGIVLLMLLSGTVALHRVLHGRFSPWPLMAAFFLYNWIFLFGFINYLFGVGVMLWSVAAWLALARASVASRLAAGTVLAVTALICHLVAFGLFAVILAGIALTEAFVRWRETRRLAFGVLLLPAVPVGIAFALFVALSPTAGEVHQPFAYAAWFGWKPLIAYRTLLWSIPWLNFVTIVPIVALVAIAAWRRKLQVTWSMSAPIMLLCVTFLAMPDNLLGGQYADARLPIAVLLVVIATCDVVLPAPRLVITCVTLAMGLLIVRSAVIAREWRETASILAQYNTAFDLLPPGATLYVASVEPFPKLAYVSPEELARWHPPLKHVVSLASIDRDVFVPATWADRSQQPISVLPKDTAAKRLQGDNPFLTPGANELADVVTRIRSLREPGATPREFLLLLRPEALNGMPPSKLTVSSRGSTFALYRIE